MAVIPFVEPLFFIDLDLPGGQPGDPNYPTEYVSWHGAPPYLDTADGDASYGNVYQWQGSRQFTCGARYAWTPPPVLTRLDATVQVRMHWGAASTWANQARFQFSDHTDAELLDIAFDAPDGEWTTYTVDLLAELSWYGEDTMRQVLAQPFSIGAACYGQRSIDVTLVQLETDVVTIPPLRQVQRDDGLLRSAKRARGGRSRQGSLRQRGYL